MDGNVGRIAELLGVDPRQVEDLLAEVSPVPEPISDLALAAHLAEDTPGEPVTDPVLLAELLGGGHDR